MREDRNVTVSPGMAWIAGLPILGCMLVMGLPSLADPKVLVFRLFYTAAYLAWIVPLGWLQRVLWRREASAWTMAAWLLPISYAMSVANALFALEFLASPAMRARVGWAWVFGGLDGCWLALIAFCGMQAMVLHRAELRAEGLRLREASQAARDAELRALRYQLQPHFLFNTLNAISALVRDDRKRDATRMIARLGDFLRATLEQSPGHEVTVADEIAFTSTYLDIEKARLGDRLRVNIHTGPDTLDAQVPYLLLQPLVENAIRHGIAPRREGGRIDIRVERDGGTLRVWVDNDRFDGPSAGGQGVGLANVRARLDALYPGNHLLEAGPRGDRWRTAVTLPGRSAVMQATA
ncbi:two-component system, LytT family, sensor histidine kinase AlgZ [Luteibacter sp. 22Crub2.1]|nr:two-component system, LytT family, sensor histidine kinase AlgZ [Luteibacter sp. 22Crub2.1]